MKPFGIEGEKKKKLTTKAEGEGKARGGEQAPKDRRERKGGGTENEP